MTTSFSYTMPSLADTLRFRGDAYYPTSSGIGLDLLTGPSDADSVHHQFSRGGIDTSKQRVAQAFLSTQRFLLPRATWQKSGNTASQPFGASSSQNGKMGYSGGTNTATQGSRLSDADYESYRQDLLRNRTAQFQAKREGIVPPQQVPSLFQQTSGNKQTIDLLLTSIEERAYEDIFSPEIYKELQNLTNLFISTVADFNDVNVISNYINRLETIARENVDLEVGPRGVRLTPQEEKQLKSIQSIIDRLVKYLNNNLRGVGANEIIRKRLASDISVLKLSMAQKQQAIAQAVAQEQAQQGGPDGGPDGGDDDDEDGGDDGGGDEGRALLELIARQQEQELPEELLPPPPPPAPDAREIGRQRGKPSVDDVRGFIANPNAEGERWIRRAQLDLLSGRELADIAKEIWGYKQKYPKESPPKQSIKDYIYRTYGLGRGGRGMIPPHMRHQNQQAMTPALRALMNAR